jgi:membrane-bound serine protease (ClpP class)
MQIPFDPNIAYLLLVGGFMLAILAMFAPGTGFIEITAIFMLVLAGWGIYSLPINIWALVVLLIGVIPFAVAMRRSHSWVYGLIAMAALVVGSSFLFRLEDGSPAVNPVLAAFVSILAVGFLWLAGKKGMEAILLRPSHNLDRLVGSIGEAHTDINRQGSVYVGGEEWSAVSTVFIPSGSPVKVISREGLVLRVDPVSTELPNN